MEQHDSGPRPAETRSETFARFYQQHHEAVMAYLWSKVRRWEDAEDLTELTFTKALDGWDRCQYPPDGRKPWLIRIAANVAIDHFRWAGVRSTTGLADAATVASRDDPARDAEAAALRACWRHALDGLTAHQRDIAILYFGGTPEREIALIMGQTLGAVRSAVHRIRLILRDDPSLQAWAA